MAKDGVHPPGTVPHETRQCTLTTDYRTAIQPITKLLKLGLTSYLRQLIMNMKMRMIKMIMDGSHPILVEESSMKKDRVKIRKAENR